MKISRLRYFFVLVPMGLYLGVAAGFAGFGVGRDYLAYLFSYEDIRLSDALNVFRFEPGFVAINWVSRFGFGLEFPAFVSILTTSTLLTKFWLFNQSRAPLLTVLFYLCCWYPLHEYTQLRTALALAFAFVAAEFFFQRRFVAFAIMMALAASFHTTALMLAAAIPGAYFLSIYRLPMIILAATGLALAFSLASGSIIALASYFNPLVETYAANVVLDTVNLLSGTNLLTVALLFSILFANSLKDRRDRTFFILVLLGLAVALAFQAIPVFSHRLKEMLFVFLVPLAFNARPTDRGLLQYTTAIVLAAWTLYSHMSQGVIGAVQ